ncbi:hypothetical protein [Egicoccus sp. AB-alg2]|uniref:hypothetical protein n=1 Tax=Egicoccus sp. AB-alg2 TaxID=3242693 RepID=UPI00359E964C
MSDSPSAPADLDPSPGRTDDPLSADRRVLIVGAASMVALILVGVVSAAVFTRSACAGIDPEPILPRTAGTDLDAVLAEGLPDLFDDERAALASYLNGTLASRLGPVAAAADVTGAQSLAVVGGPDGDLVAAIGRTTTVLDAADAEVRDTAEVGDGTIVGDGATLYSLALTNPMTGQTDAIVPVDVRLDGGDCLDTATVGTSFAFHLSAGDGQLLLFRVEEDGEFPQLELRDAQQGQVWISALDVPEIPPGVTGERLDAAMGSQLVVLGRRTAADEAAPVVSAFDRATGDPMWAVDLDDLEGAAPDGDSPVWADVLTVSDEGALVALSREDDRDVSSLVALDVADGSVRWAREAEAATPVSAGLAPDAGIAVVLDAGGEVVARQLAASDGESLGEIRVADPDGAGFDGRAGIAEAPQGTFAAMGGGLAILGTEENAVLESGITEVLMTDVVTVDDHVVVLLRSDDGAVAVTYGS